MASVDFCFVGDSITVGYTDAEKLGWPGRLCRGLVCDGLPVACYNLGVNGETAADIAPRWRAEVEARTRGRAPRLLVFMFGGNDASIRVGQGPLLDIEESCARARAIMTEARGLGPVLWVSQTPADEDLNPMVEDGVTWEMWNRDGARYSAAYAGIATELGVPYLDLLPQLVGDARYTAALKASDGLHPATDGYDRIAELIAAWDAWQAAVA